MRIQETNVHFRRAIAWLLCLCLIGSMFSGLRFPRADAASTGSGGTNGVTRQADPSTMDDYKNMLDFSNDTRYAGRLWSDKTVFALSGDSAEIAKNAGDRENQWNGNTLTLTKEDDGVTGSIKLDEDFLHVYSALGSSLQVSEPLPADLVLALDISGSMGSPIQNESSGWVNTVDPAETDDNAKAHGLGYYQGTKNGGAGDTTNVAKEDKNGIPDKIVAAKPTGYNNGDSGQMSSSAFSTYNTYLTFCNALVDALVTADKNNDGTLDSGEVASVSVSSIANVTTYLPTDKQTSDNYQELYAAYQTYKNSINSLTENAWLSDPTANDGKGRNAAWPDAGWKAALGTEPTNPMLNAPQAPNRLYYVISAANNFIEQFLALNEENRISVVVYDSVATVLMPLAHYEKAGTDGYLSAEKHHWQNWGEGQWACTVTATAKPTAKSYAGDEDSFNKELLKDGTYTASVTSWGNTDTQAAVNAGLDILAHSKDSYSDMQDRTPMLVLMTDGAANTILTGVTGTGDSLTKEQTFEAAWTKGATKSKTDNTQSGKDRYNSTDGMVMVSNYNTLTAVNAFKDKTSSGLTTYAAGAGHVYGSESHYPTRYTVVLHTLMSIAYQKTLVEQHYNNPGEMEDNAVKYPDDTAKQDDWTNALIYTIGFGLDKYSGNEIQDICAEILDPAETFKPEAEITDNDQRKAMNRAYQQWLTQENYDSSTDEQLKTTGKDSNYNGKVTEFQSSADKSSLDGSSNTLHTGSLQFPIKTSDLTNDKNNVTKEDIDRNIRYDAKYFTASMEGSGDDSSNTLQGVFEQILGMIEGTIFTPVVGGNDLGVEDSVTYMDPIGKYMDVKDVKNLSLFGKLYGITKTAVYDYQWNHQYMVNQSKDTDPLPEGWYLGTPSEGNNNGVQYSKELPNGYSKPEQAWAAGWVYRLSYENASKFVPTLKDINNGDSSNATVTKQRKTVYTFYRFDLTDEQRKALHVNPAYLENGQKEEEVLKDIKYSDTGEHQKTPGVYALADLRIWVEDSGDYSDPDVSGTLSDANFDEALWINIPGNMLPLRTITINNTAEGTLVYKTNQDSTFPLRVFYTVGISEDVLENSRRINIAGAIGAEYVKQNKITTAAAQNARNIAQGNLEFFSNWYNPLNRYTDYVTTQTDYTFGDPVTSFSPSEDNRYYIFEKALPLYSTAYVFDASNGTDGSWRKVVIGEDLDASDEDGRTFDATQFGGHLIAQDLEVAGNQDTTESRQNAIWQGLEKAGIKKDEVKDQDMIVLKDHRMTDVEKPTEGSGKEDPFSSDNYYFLAIEYYELNKDGNTAEKTQYLITRKGSEFGSAYQSAHITNGDMLCWHDVSGKYPDYPYLSYTETNDTSRGRKYIGTDLGEDGYYKDKDQSKHQVPDQDNTQDQKAKDILQNGQWVVSAKPGGLRVGNLAQSVQAKSGNYSTPDQMDEYVSDRFGSTAEAQDKTWGYYANNVTRTANNYYVPTISATSDVANNNAVVNVYLGNNGRLYVPDTTLLVSKLIKVPTGGTVDKTEEFNFQVFINGITGKQTAVVIRWNEETESWQRQFHYIDLELDNQLFLQTQDGQKAMVDKEGCRLASDGNGGYTYAADCTSTSGATHKAGDTYTVGNGNEVYYVFIGHNSTTGTGVDDTAFRVYHNDAVDNSEKVDENDVIAKYDDDGCGVFTAGKVCLVSVDQYNDKWAGKDPVADGTVDFESNKELISGCLEGTFELLTLDPNASDTTEISIDTPYLTSSTYWTKDVEFGKNANPNDGSGTVGSELQGTDLYDQIIPTGDRPDYFSGMENSEIAKHTAEFTLKHGEALLFSGIPSATVYRVTEKLTDAQMDAGYSLQEVSHTQQVGSSSTYRPGSQLIPVYYDEENGKTATYEWYGGGAYPTQYDEKTTEKGLMWALSSTGTKNDDKYLHYEPFHHTNAVVWDSYSTMDAKAKGDNHHQPESVPDGTSTFWLWNGSSSENTGVQHNVGDNPSCKPLEQGGCDETLDNGQVRHYFFKDGELLDVHYQGEGSGYIRNIGRYITSPTVHFAVTGEQQDDATKDQTKVTPNIDYTGVYSVFGNTGTYEESANFVNTVNHDKTETAINGDNTRVQGDGTGTQPGVQAGDTITYEIKWANSTGENARVVIIDPLDDGVDFKEAGEKGQYYKTADEANEALAEIYKEAKNPPTVDSGHVVIWDLGEVATGTNGAVTLTVTVNDKAAEWWDYDGDGVAEKPVDAKEDHLVRNRATVRVAENSYNTNTIVNPVGEPSKTEISINADKDNKQDVKSEDLILGEDGKYHGPVVKPGDTITYEITWRNYEDRDATVTIRDPLDPNVRFVSASFDPANTKDDDDKAIENAKPDKTDLNADTKNGSVKSTDKKASGYGKDATEQREVITYDADNHEVTWNLGTQKAGASGKVTLVVEVLDSATPVGYVDNTAFVAVNGDPEQHTETIENPTPHQEKKEVTPGDGVMVGVGDTITYEITWRNYNDTPARVIVMDTLDPGVDYVSTDPNTTYHKTAATLTFKDTDETIEIPAHTVVWVLEDQAGHAEGKVKLTVKVNENAKLEYTYGEPGDDMTQGNGKDYKVLNQAAVKVGDDPFFTTQIVENPVPEKDETKIEPATGSTANENPELTQDPKQDNTFNGPTVFVGDKITYSIHWTNGHDEAATVTITDVLDPGVTFISADNDGVYNKDTHTVTWTLENQEAKATGSVTLVVEVNANATLVGQVDNQAVVQVGNDEGVETEVLVNPTPQVEKTEVDPGEGMPVMPGDFITYHIHWKNYKKESATVTITDKLDPGVDFFAAWFGTEKPSDPDEKVLDGSETSAPMPTSANLTLTIQGEGEDEVNLTLTLTAPEGEELKSEGYKWTKGEDSGTWTASNNTISMKPGETLTLEGLSVGTTYTLKNGETVVVEGQTLGTWGSVVTVTVETPEPAPTEPDPTDPPTEPNPSEPSPANPSEPTTPPSDPAPSGDPEPTDGPTEPTPTEMPTEPAPTEQPSEPAPGEPTASVMTLSAPVEVKTPVVTASVTDLPAPIAEVKDDKITVSFNDGTGNVTITYDPATHTVTWTLESRPSESEGDVSLTVQVNQDAEKLWSYDHPDWGPSGNELDERVRNQAGVKVGNDPEVKTRIIENPTEPRKTETEINGDDVSHDLVADENGYVGPEVNVGDTITYQIDWINNATNESGEYTEAEITITDELDDGVDFVSATEGGTYDPATHTVTWKLGKKDAMARGHVNLTVRVNSDAVEPAKVINEATVTVGNTSHQTNRVENPVGKRGGLTVTKTVSGNLGDKEKAFNFTVTLSDTTINGKYGDMEFANGVATFTLKHGQSITARDLPVDITYTVVETEANQDDYTTTATGDTGTIPEGDIAQAEFHNRKVSQPEPHKVETDPGDGKMVLVGQEITYEITWQNRNAVPTEITITDVLDPNVAFVRADNSGAYDKDTRTVTWTFTAQPDTEGKVTLVVKVLESAAGKIVENQATVKIGNETFQTEKPENPVPDPHKTEPDPGAGEGVGVGDKITYNVSWWNYQKTEATVTITDKLDPGVKFISASDGGKYDETTRTVTWTLTAKAGEKGYVELVVEVTEDAIEPGEVVNTAKVKVGNDHEFETEPVENPVHDPHKTETDPGNKLPVNVGDVITYEITWQNHHDHDTTIVITDKLDDNVEFNWADHEGKYAENTRTVTWTFTAKAGEEGKVTLKVKVLPSAAGLIVYNQAHVQIGNEHFDTEIPENPVPDPHKTEVTPGDGKMITVGEEITYEITWKNYREEEATVTIRDPLDEGLDFLEASDGGQYDPETHTVTWTFENQPAGTEGKVTLKVRVNEKADVIGQVQNQAFVQVGHDPEIGTEIPWNPTPDPHKIEVTPGDGNMVTVGEEITYEITWQNLDPEKATVTIRDPLDEGVDFVSADHEGKYDENIHTVTWTFETDGKTEGKVKLTVKVNEKARPVGIVKNQAFVQVGNHPEVATEIPENPVPDPHKTETNPGDGKMVHVGQEITYEISWQNLEDETATVTIRDPLDEGVDFVSADHEGKYDEATRTVTWTFTAEAGAKGEVSLTVKVNEKAREAGIVKNQAFVKVGNHPEVATEIPENPVPDPHKVETNPGDGKMVHVGQEITYEISWQNQDPEKATVTIRDPLDEGVDFVSADHEGKYDETTHTVTWTFETDGKTEGKVKLTVKVNEKARPVGIVKNQAFVQVGNHPEVATEIPENPVPDPHKTETTPGDRKPVMVGDEITYEISWQNLDPEKATVTIRDPLDEGVDFVSADHEGKYDETTRTVTWTFTAEAGAKGKVSLTVKVNEKAKEAGIVKNQAFVKVGNHPEVATEIPENPVPDPHKTEVTPGAGEGVKVGDKITYNITWWNYQETEATVTITDTLDPGVKFISASDDGKYDETTRTVTWTLTAKAGEKGYVELVVEVTEDAIEPGEVVNTAKVKVGNDSEYETEPVENPVHDPHKTETDPGDKIAVEVGQVITYEITWQNHHDHETTIVITDPLDENVAFVSADHEGKYDETTRTVTWTFEAEPGAEGKVTLKVEVLPSAAGLIVYNQAHVQIGEQHFDTEIPENPVPNPEKTETDPGEGEGVKVGDKITYNITWWNYQETEATVTITDTLDPGVKFISASDGSVYDEATHTVTWSIKAAAGATGSVELVVEVTEAAIEPGEVVNTAKVKVGNDSEFETEPVENPVHDPHKTETDPGNKLPVNVGDIITYEITWQNHHDRDTTITITDPLDENVKFVSADCDGKYNEATRTVTWTFTAKPDTEGHVTLKVEVLPSAAGKIVYNQAHVQIGNEHYDTEIPENPVPDPHKTEVTPGDGKMITVGEEITYEITWKNYREEEATVTIRDPLDEGLDFLEASHGGHYDPETHTVTWTFENQPAGAEGKVTLKVRVNEKADVVGQVKNQAFVQVGHDPEIGTEIPWNPTPDPHKNEVTPGDGNMVAVGEEITYEITWQNLDPEEATVTIRDPLDEGVDFVSADHEGKYDAATHTVTWTFKAEANTAGKVSLTVKVNEKAREAGVVKNQAFVKVENHPEVETEIPENPVPDPHKTEITPGDRKPVMVGDEITYEITWQNLKQVEATVTIRDPLDEGVDFVSADHEGKYDAATHTVTWTFTAPAHTEGKVTLTVKVNAKALTPLKVKNQAFVKVGNLPEIATEIPENPVEVPPGELPKTGDSSPLSLLVGMFLFSLAGMTMLLASCSKKRKSL